MVTYRPVGNEKSQEPSTQSTFWLSLQHSSARRLIDVNQKKSRTQFCVSILVLHFIKYYFINCCVNGDIFKSQK
jgi:hypothetical protein